MFTPSVFDFMECAKDVFTALGALEQNLSSYYSARAGVPVVAGNSIDLAVFTVIASLCKDVAKLYIVAVYSSLDCEQCTLK